MSDLITQWREARERWEQATAAGRSPKYCNRIMDEARSLATQIAGTPVLHSEIERLCGTKQTPAQRVAAALVREHWDVNGAADTFLSVAQSTGTPLVRPVTMQSALAVGSLGSDATTAALCLFNIDRGTGNVG